MRAWTGLLLSLLVLPACISGDGGPDVGFVSDADNCDELADVAMILLQRTLDDLEGVTISDLTAEDRPEAIERYDDRKQAIRDRADDLECTPEQVEVLISERIDRLAASGPVPQAVLQEIETRGVFETDGLEPAGDEPTPED